MSTLVGGCVHFISGWLGHLWFPTLGRASGFKTMKSFSSQNRKRYDERHRHRAMKHATYSSPTVFSCTGGFFLRNARNPGSNRGGEMSEECLIVANFRNCINRWSTPIPFQKKEVTWEQSPPSTSVKPPFQPHQPHASRSRPCLVSHAQCQFAQRHPGEAARSPRHLPPLAVPGPGPHLGDA